MKKNIDIYNLTIAHRGLFNNKDIVENSISSLRRALDRNIPVELDVRLTKDKVLVVFHDANLKRLTGVDNNISDVTYEEIRRLKLLDTDQKIPTLKGVLSLINGKVLIDIEIKVNDDIEDVGKVIIDNLKDYNGEYIVKSFNPKMIRWFMKNHPEVSRGLLIADNYVNKFYNYLFTSKLIMLYCKPDFLAVSKKIIDTKKIQKFRKKYPILVWTIENVNEFNKYKSLADSYICNNLPY